MQALAELLACTWLRNYSSAIREYSIHDVRKSVHTSIQQISTHIDHVCTEINIYMRCDCDARADRVSDEMHRNEY